MQNMYIYIYIFRLLVLNVQREKSKSNKMNWAEKVSSVTKSRSDWDKFLQLLSNSFIHIHTHTHTHTPLCFWRWNSFIHTHAPTHTHTYSVFLKVKYLSFSLSFSPTHTSETTNRHSPSTLLTNLFLSHAPTLCTHTHTHTHTHTEYTCDGKPVCLHKYCTYAVCCCFPWGQLHTHTHLSHSSYTHTHTHTHTSVPLLLSLLFVVVPIRPAFHWVRCKTFLHKHVSVKWALTSTHLMESL